MRGPRSGWGIAVTIVVALVALAGCSDDKPGSGPATSAARPSAGTAAPGPAPAWERLTNYSTVAGQQNTMIVRLYPLQRIDGRVLLTVDLVPQGTAGQTTFNNHQFCLNEGCNDLSGLSLVDTANRVRFGPLLAGNASGKPLSSVIGMIQMKVGNTYRFGAFFADPGAGVNQLAVDLRQAGIAPRIPIVDGAQPAAGLVLPAGSPDTKVGSPGVVQGKLVTWPTVAPGSDAFDNRHDLLARIAGGTVNDSGGTVSLNADVLFAFDSAKLSGRAKALIAKTAQILAAKADASKPVAVVGYTDAKGDPGYNLKLSQQRAQAVRTALAASASAGGFSLQASGRGEKDPVAANVTSNGKDNPDGRALNRRVEIGYTRKPAPAPSSASSGGSVPTSSGGASSTTSLGPVQVALQSGSTMLTAQISPISVEGELSLVELDLTAQTDVTPIGAFSSVSTSSRDIGAFHVVDPATKQVFVPVVDKDDPIRVLSTNTHRMAANLPYHYAFFVAALPDGLNAADLSLAAVGTAKSVSVSR